MPKVIFPRSALAFCAAERPCPLPTPRPVPADWPLSPSSSARRVTRRQNRRCRDASSASSNVVVEPELCRSAQTETARPVAWHNARPWGVPDSFSGIKDPHRVSQETEAPGEARAHGTCAGQPQNESGAPQGRAGPRNCPDCSRAGLAPTGKARSHTGRFLHTVAPSLHEVCSHSRALLDFACPMQTNQAIWRPTQTPQESLGVPS